jgi:dienelactone hydrolase
MRPLRPFAVALTVTGLVLWFSARSAPASDGAAPIPDTYPHKSIKKQELGNGARSYWLFEPAEPTPALAPVVVLNHGWLGVNPASYGAWISHLTRSGSIVIFPRYQADAITKPSEFLPNAVSAVNDALDVLDAAPGHVRPDRNRFVLMGHSAGGNLAALMAASAAESRLPKARAVIAMMPGELQAIRDIDLAKIPADTLLIVAVAEDDRVVGDARARQIFTEASAIPTSRKKFILYRTDLHGNPWLVAHHFAPTALDRAFDNGDGIMKSLQMSQAEVNVLDRIGFWRMADLVMSAAFAGKTLDEASNFGNAFRHLGYWSDGKLVEQPVVDHDLTKIPRVYPTNGVRLFSWPEFGSPRPDAPTIAVKPGSTVKN